MLNSSLTGRATTTLKEALVGPTSRQIVPTAVDAVTLYSLLEALYTGYSPMIPPKCLSRAHIKTAGSLSTLRIRMNSR